MESSGETSSQRCRQLQSLEDREYASYIHLDAEEKKPKIDIHTRIKLMTESEERRRKEAYERGIKAWKTNKIPRLNIIIKPESKSETVAKPGKSTKKENQIDVKEKECLERLEKNVKDTEESSESKKKKDAPEHDADVKKCRRDRPIEYFWKPDPLFYLHLTQLGYSRTAAEKALYRTNNKSVDLAEKYIQEHPDITPLTKEEVLADAEAFLNEIRSRCLKDENSDQNASLDAYDIKEESDEKMQLCPEERSFQAHKIEHYEEENEEPSPHPKEKVKSSEETEQAEEKVELHCVINTDCDFNAATLAIQCSRATMKIMEELQNDKWRKLGEDWTKYGKCVNTYQIDGVLHLYELQNELLHHGHLSHLAEIQNPHSSGSTLPVVLFVLTSSHNLESIYPRLSKAN